MSQRADIFRPPRMGAEPSWMSLLDGGATPGPTATAPAVLGPAVALHFYRCGDCFGTLALESAETGARCDCGGKLDYLGRAKHERLIIDGLEVPCDSRCVNARGPKCECGCCGANHGSGALVVVEIDAGGVPVASKPADFAKRRGIAELYRSRLARVQAAYAEKVGAVVGEDRAAWQIREQIKNAQKFKTQKRRLAAIDAAEALLVQYRRTKA